jgi:hypothetical protein
MSRSRSPPSLSQPRLRLSADMDGSLPPHARPARKKWARGLIIAGLILWPMLHMGLSLTGHFSPWRFAGWGMYATPYPSANQRPLALLLDLGAPNCDRARSHRIAVMSGAHDLSGWLEERAGLRVFARCDQPQVTSVQLGKGDIGARLLDEARAIRQLDTTEHLEAIARLVDERLTAHGNRPRTLYINLGERRADPLSGTYGIENRYFRYDGVLEAGPVTMMTGTVTTAQ